MQLLNGIYDAALLVYALSLLFVFSDCLKRSPGGKRLGTGLLVVVGLCKLQDLEFVSLRRKACLFLHLMISCFGLRLVLC